MAVIQTTTPVMFSHLVTNMANNTAVDYDNFTGDSQDYDIFSGDIQDPIMDTVVDYDNYSVDIQDPNMEECFPADNIPMFTLIIHGILLTLIGILGLCGNTISLIVLTKAKMRSSSMNCCLIGLTIFDMLVIITSILMIGIFTMADYAQSIELLNLLDVAISYVLYPFGMIAQTGSVYCTVMVTFERFVAVCMPLRARSLITTRRAKIYVCGVAIFAIIFNISRFQEIYLTECMEDNVVHTILDITDLRADPIYTQVYVTYAYLIFMYFVPFLSLIIFNAFIYITVHKANQQRSQMSRNQQKEISLAVMLLVIVFVFFICNTLALVIIFLEIFDNIMPYLTQFSNFLVTVNSSVNFIIYCIYGKNFRKHFLKIFCHKGYKQVDKSFVDSMYDSRNFSTSRTQTLRLSRIGSMYNNRSSLTRDSLTRQTSIMMRQNSNTSQSMPTNNRHSLQTQIKKDKEIIAVVMEVTQEAD